MGSTFPIVVVMQMQLHERPLAHKKWAPLGVARDDGVIPASGQMILNTADCQQFAYSGFLISLFKEQIEEYVSNINSPQPKVFVAWRMDGLSAIPVAVTLSTHEAVRLEKKGEVVAAVAMPYEVHLWVDGFVRLHSKADVEVDASRLRDSMQRRRDLLRK
jgi:Protein of unknown function (DUF3305)